MVLCDGRLYSNNLWVWTGCPFLYGHKRAAARKDCAGALKIAINDYNTNQSSRHHYGCL